MATRTRRPLVPLLRAEIPLLFTATTTGVLLAFGNVLTANLAQPLGYAALFFWLFAAVLWSALAVVRHADHLAAQLGEPYGTLILTLSVISIEVMMISALMLSGENNPTLARDTMFSVVMIVLNGMVGTALLLGGLRYREQQYNLQGANAYLSVILPLAVLGLVLPGFTDATPDATFSSLQAGFLIFMSTGLYGVFLAIQTSRHRAYFTAAAESTDNSHTADETRSIAYHAVLLVVYLLPVVILSKKLALPVDYGIEVLGAPPGLGGFIIAALVLAPEALGAIRAALSNHLQRAINIFLGSVLATIGLTIPAVLAIGLATGKSVVLGLAGANLVMLLLTLIVSVVTFASGRTNVLQGAVHLLLFLAYLMLIFEH